MARPTQKTPEQLIAELETRLANARLRTAKAVAVGNPQVAKVQSVLDSVNKEIADYSRKLVGPNSFENRIKGIALRSAWIEAERNEIVASDTLARNVKDYLQHSMASLAVRVSEGQAITDGDVQSILDNVPTDPNLPALMQATSDAHTAWKGFTESNKVKLAVVPTENTEGA